QTAPVASASVISAPPCSTPPSVQSDSSHFSRLRTSDGPCSSTSTPSRSLNGIVRWNSRVPSASGIPHTLPAPRPHVDYLRRNARWSVKGLLPALSLLFNVGVGWADPGWSWVQPLVDHASCLGKRICQGLRDQCA